MYYFCISLNFLAVVQVSVFRMCRCMCEYLNNLQPFIITWTQDQVLRVILTLAFKADIKT